LDILKNENGLKEVFLYTGAIATKINLTS